ncbi:MAG TPA: hypothetical protein H9704_10140, partial [Candidatus Enterocloster excrementipullorum]|nr:hypothetical protein [Candidatus Enterocloster excrementipullorum]
MEKPLQWHPAFQAVLQIEFAEEITITLVGNHYPRKLIAFLKTRYGVRVENPYPGIFYIEGLLF